MESFESLEFFLEKGRCNMLEFGAFLGSCRDKQGQRVKSLALLEHFGIVPRKTDRPKCYDCGLYMTARTDAQANALGWRWMCKGDDSTKGCGKTVKSPCDSKIYVTFQKEIIHAGIPVKGNFTR